MFLCFVGGPLIYYRGTILNSYALTNKYSKEGLKLQGKVVAQRKDTSGEAGPTYHVKVMYRVESERYVTNEMNAGQELYSNSKLDLIRLPDYPKSAILLASVDGFDTDFPPSKLPSIYFGLFWMSCWNGVTISTLLVVLDATNLTAPIFWGMTTLELLVGYWVAARDRNHSLKSTLHGAKRVARRNSSSPDIKTPDHLSYFDLVGEPKHSVLFVLSTICLDLATAVAWICVAIYFVIFGGGYIIMYSVVVSRWRYQLLKCYESNAIQELGTVISRQGHTLIVRYKVDEQLYKKRLLVPYHMVRSGCSHRQEHEIVPDSPDLLYINGNPASAILKCEIDNSIHQRKRFQKGVFAGVYVMLIQVYLVTFIVGAIFELEGHESFLLLAGTFCSCELVFGLVGACIHHTFVYKKDLLFGAKRVLPRATENDEVLDEEQELDIGVSLGEDCDELTASTQAALDGSEHTETMVEKFMARKYFT